LLTSNRVFKHKEVVSKLHVWTNDLEKMWASYIFHFSTRILTLTHMKLFEIFSHNVSLCRIFTFQLPIMPKLLAKHIRTIVSLKIIIRKRHVYIDTCWTWTWNKIFYLVIWNYYRTKIIALPSFQLATRLNSQNRKETDIINELWHINLFINNGTSNWNIWSFDPT